jgi:hypothetical protein
MSHFFGSICSFPEHPMSDNNKHLPRFCFDEIAEQMTEAETIGDRLDACISAIAFKTLDFMPKRLPFVLELVTRKAYVWRAILAGADERYWCKRESSGVALYRSNECCGYERLYFYSNNYEAYGQRIPGLDWKSIPSLDVLYVQLDTEAAKHVFSAWVAYRTKVTELPTVFINGKLSNTDIHHAWVLSGTDGCLLCAAPATAYAATTAISMDQRSVVACVAVCNTHLLEAKRAPNLLMFIASVFSLQLDIEELESWESVPDWLVPILRDALAERLMATAHPAEQRPNGWVLKFDLAGGWQYVLRMKRLLDYSYTLLDPNGKEIFRADSAPDHPELPFFPHHQHAKPWKKAKKDTITPSFLYGLPILDVRLLRSAAQERGVVFT